MLRRIRLKNFIHFDDEQDIKLGEGPHFCIGQNGSGKSALLEAIRRCMSTSKSMGMSSCHDAHKPSVAMCYIDFGKDIDNVHGNVISCVIRLPNIIDHSIKLVCFKDKQEVHVYIDELSINSEGVVVNQSKPLVDTDKAAFVRILNNEDGILDNLIQKLVTIPGIRDSGLKYDESTECETFLRTYVDKNVVITYPMRSIAPVQWTNSSKLNPNNILKANQEIQERAEILSWYFDDNIMSSEIKSKVNEYFWLITDNSTVEFFREDGGKLYAREAKESARIGIEKIPEGYYEAMNCAIILAYPCFKTVCLEEPGRGMHPQMVERLRDLILKDIEGKVVIITSHKPAFVAAWNVPRTLFFRKKHSGRGVIRLKIIHGKTLEGEGASSEPTRNKTMRFTTTRHFSTLYFARRVLLLEGGSDIIFVSEMKSLLLEPDNTPLIIAALDKALYQLSEGGEEGYKEHDSKAAGKIDEFRRFMWPLHILSLNGETNKTKLELVCKKLEIERYFVLDYDAICNAPGKKGTDAHNVVSPGDEVMQQNDNDVNVDLRNHSFVFKNFLNDFQNPTYKNGSKVTEEDIRNDVSCLEKLGIFVWKDQGTLKKDKTRGALETSIQELHNKTKTKSKTESNLRTVLEGNHVRLQWNYNKRVKHRQKLFVHKHISDENILNVMREVLVLCNTEEGRSSDIFRFIVFLCKIFLEYQSNENINGSTVQ